MYIVYKMSRTTKSNTPPTDSDIKMTMKISTERMCMEGDSYIDMMIMLYKSFLEENYKVIVEIHFVLKQTAISIGSPQPEKLKEQLKLCCKSLYKPAYVERINFLKNHSQEEWNKL